MKSRMSALALLAGVGLSAQADELATVISSTPILEQVSIPATVCVNRQVTVQGEKSGGGALLGAVAGGAVGNAIGQGSGNALATAIGLIGGAVIGDRVEGAPVATTQNVQDCHQENRIETRTRAYRVVYEYAGKRYEIETPTPPGPTLPVRVSPAVPLSAAPTLSTPSYAARSTAVSSSPQVAVRVAPVVIRWNHHNGVNPREIRTHGHERRVRRHLEAYNEERGQARF